MGCSQTKSAKVSDDAGGGAGGAGSSNSGGGSGSISKSELDYLSKVELFKRLGKEDQAALAKVTKPQEFNQGEVIINQGDEGNEFFVLKSGTAKCEVNGGKVADLKSGDFFGEMALLRNEPRMATITATEKTQTLKITREDFVSLGLIEKLDFQKRNAVRGGEGGEVEIKPPSPKNEEDKALMREALKNNENLSKIYSLDDIKITNIIDLMWLDSVKTGVPVIKQGDADADYFYIVKEGSFAITIDNKDNEGGKSAGTMAAAGVGTVKKGGSFGELALMYHAPRAATLTAKEDSELWVIDRKQFKGILAKSADDLLLSNVKYLDKIGLLKDLKDDEKKELAKALSDMMFYKGETVFSQGEVGTLLYILIEGEVSIEKDGKTETTLVATSENACIFGERALLSGEPRAASIHVHSATAKALTIDKQSFDMLIGPLDEIIKRGKDGTAVVKKAQAGAVGGDDQKRFGVIFRKDLSMLGLLGCGGFGAVHLVEHKPTKNTYALKALSKGYVVKSGMQSSVMMEKNVQLMCDSYFIVKLYETYNGEQSLYLLLELAIGGELYATYNKKQFWGKEDLAQFYVAGTTFAFDHLHSKKIIFRDLKPENLLMNEKGEVKLTDMGLAKVVVGKTNTTCGTPDYFAPEVIASKGHSHAVDWWTLGVLSFELMVGHPPFESATPMQIYQKVSKGINKVAFPKKCPQNCEGFVKALCHQNPSERLPMKKGGIKNIKTHAWFKGFAWEDMEKLKMVPPYKPTVKNAKDIANFSARKEDMPPQVPYKDPKTGWDKDFATSS
jgi:cGMP-dependent protein kinase